MINSTTDREEGNHGLEMGRSLRAPDLDLAWPLEIQRCRGEVTKLTHTHTDTLSLQTAFGHTANGEKGL